MTHDMKKTLTRLFTVALLMMVSMGARAEVKVLFGENGTEKYEGKGGTIQVKQEESRDGGKVTVRLAFIPEKNYTFDEQSLEVYKVFSPESSATRALEIDGDALKLEEDKSTNPSEKHYHVDIDSKLALWVRTATFTNLRKGGEITVTYHIINLGRLNDNGQLTTNRTEALKFTSDEGTITLPAQFKSPLATNWKFYAESDVTYNSTTRAYTFNREPSLHEGDPVSADADVYITYEIDEEAFSTVNIYDGGVYRIKADGNYYLQQTNWQGDPNTSFTSNNALPTTADYCWKFNIVDPYQITIQTKSGNTVGSYGKLTDFYLCKGGNYGDIRLRKDIATAKDTKVWSYGLLPGGTEGTYRIIITDGATANENGMDEYGHGYINRGSGKSRYNQYSGSSYNKCDLTFTPLTYNYTYNIVDKDNRIAIKYTTTTPELVGRKLTSYTDIPEAIRSPYLSNEEMTFYSFSGAYDVANLKDENLTDGTPFESGANIYVRYTTDHLTDNDRILHLQGTRIHNIKVNGDYIYDNSGTLAHESTDANKKQLSRIWYISGQDPYAVQIQNAASPNRYLEYNTATGALTLTDSPTNYRFILLEGSEEGNINLYEQMELVAATGTTDLYRITRDGDAFSINTSASGDAVQVQAYSETETLHYYLIDKSKKLIEGPIDFAASRLSLPDEWISPLVTTYHYYTSASVSDGIYTVDSGTEVTQLSQVSEGDNIYVTYDVGDAIDITGNITYMMRFDGEYFNQEDGDDGVMTTTRKALYPYNNGDFNLYVYGKERWEAQLESGASTRSRWLWYVVSKQGNTLLTGSDKDPYHVVIKSFQDHTLKYKDPNDDTKDITTHGSAYLRTYKPTDYANVVTSVSYWNNEYHTAKPAIMPGEYVNGTPTEYMLIGTSLDKVKLVTLEEVEGERRTVNSFEQYWKNTPTAYNILKEAGYTIEEGQDVNSNLTDAQNTVLTGQGWHKVNAWANAADWSSNPKYTKKLAEGNHWFQTISMGTGEFAFEEVSLAPQVILLDKHGWEIMRTPLSDAAALKKYDSPMVEEYHWYPKASKTTGYHKYTVSDQEIIVYDADAKATANRYTHNSTTLADSPYNHFTENGWADQPAKVRTDFYVTYDVKSLYANSFTGASTDGVLPSVSYLIKQNNKWLTSDNGTTLSTTDTKPTDNDKALWYLRPNFNIDREMGYRYAGESGAQAEAKSKTETDNDNYTAGLNGFDPYNIQIFNSAALRRYLTANTTGARLDGGAWKGTSSAVSLDNITTKQTPTGYDQSTLNITNATFIAVSDDDGNMRLMPRFDNNKVMTDFTTLSTYTSAANVTQTLTLQRVTLPTVVHNSGEILDMNGHYLLASDFVLISSIGTSSEFTGIIDGQLNTLEGLTVPLVAYANGATIKNVILKNVKISQTGPVGAIAGTASGYTRIYNCGILPSNNIYVANDETSYVKSTGNSSGDVTDSYCGGLVGWLKDDSRVINCFSYANINGGTDVAGIVGHNETASNTSVSGGKYANLHTAVVNCMFYGNISGGTNRWPVYGGAMMRNDIDNGINNYDFYRAEASLGLADDSHYNCSWPAKEEYLTSYEYYRYLLNSNRELCGWWVGAPSAPSGMTTAQVQAVPKDASLIAKWVLDPIIAPYPILKAPGRYPSVINQAPQPDETNPQRIDSKTKQWVSRATASTEWTNPKDAPKTEGQILGNITVTIQDGDEHDAADVEKTFTITAMDIANNDFCYGKIQLPYYNSIFGDPTVMIDETTAEGKLAQWESRYGGNYKDKVVVGWTISSPTGDDIPSITNQSGTDVNGVAYDHTFSTNAESGYNFADRYCTTKDEQRVFAQGGYYYVPYGVTAITITAKWATAIYLDNSYNHDYDKVRMSAANDGKRFLPAGTRPASLANGQPVITNNINEIIPSGGSVYENAIVLVGNHQYRRGKADIKRTNGASTDGCTIMSADFDMDEEPDYCLIWQLGNATDRQKICPIRFDFLPVVEIGMAMKQNASTQYYSLGCYHPLGHFEVTETSLIHFGQFEFGSSLSVQAPLILNGGIYDQYCKGKNANGAGSDKINYVIVGGNIYLPSFTPGAHVGNAVSTRHCPVNVIGGRVNNLYLTGNYSESVTSNTDNPHCYIDGGNFKQVAAAGKEGITGNVFFKIDHSIIKEFYGGSTLGNKYVTGKIDVTIDNSYVTKYCGGPKFSNLEPSDINSVTTNATGTTFGVYYGGGNGGSSYMQYDYADVTVNDATATFSWENTGKLKNYTPSKYRNTAPIGYHGDYEMEIVNTSTGTDGNKAIFRTYMYSVQFAATDTGPITNNLTDCKVLTNFYGGGNLGGVKGSVISTLSGNTRVEGSVFGAGYSASVPEVTIYNKDKTPPTINVYTGIITPTPDPDDASTSTTYTWCHKNSTTNVVVPSGVVIPNDVKTGKPAFQYNGKDYFYTEQSLENLGTVNGNVILSLEGNTIVGCKYFDKEGVEDPEKSGGVFGGGAQSAVSGNTTVNIEGNTQVYGNVFGGGDKGEVQGSAEVNIKNED